MSYRTVFDMDFTTQGTQTFATDGGYTIGGYPFTKQNSSYDRLAPTLDSNGLTFAPVYGADWNLGSNQRNLSLLGVKLKDVTDGSFLSKKIRVWFYNPNNTATAGYEDAVVTIGSNSSSYEFIHKRGYGLSGVGLSSAHNTSGSYVDYVTALNSTNDVVMMDIKNIFSVKYATYFGGMTNGNWPDIKSMIIQSWYDKGLTISVPQSQSLTVASTSVCLSSQRSVSGNLYTTSFKRLRIDIGI